MVWAQTDDGVRGFLVPTDTPGFTTQDIHKKLSLRASVTSELILDDVRLPGGGHAARRGAASRARSRASSEARFGIVFGAVGAARACYEAALDYAGERDQFGRPIAGFQLVQRKLAEMLVEVNQGALLALHLGRMKDEGRLRPEHVSASASSPTSTAPSRSRARRARCSAPTGSRSSTR